MIAPRATYRLQIQPAFTLDDAAGVLDYLDALGVSHLYTSPLLEAVPGSLHGYDIVEHARVDPARGGDAALRRLGKELAARGMGHLVDVVPNHMAVGSSNAWWQDVLENGAASRHAHCFDVEWQPPEARLHDRVLIPVLADHYGRILEAREFALERDGATFRLRYGEHALPIAPLSLDALLAEAAALCGSEELAYIADALGDLPLATNTDPDHVLRRHRDKEVLRRQLERLLATDPSAAQAVDETARAVGADPERLDALLERQNWRLARWHSGDYDLGYRRFFDVDQLVALRAEDPRVFAATHTSWLAWCAGGCADGLRIDHVDGLRDPAAYLARLHAAAPECWIVVEKILAPDERIPETWPVAGTTGYDFLALADGLYVDPAGEKPLSELYTELCEEARGFPEIAREGKEQVLREGLAADVARLGALWLEICERHRRYRDFARAELTEALRAWIVWLPRYRVYLRAGETDESERRSAAAASRAAAEARPELADALEFLTALLVGELYGPREQELVQRLQQLAAAAQAKGVEDTAFYRYHRLVSLCEVGGDPGRFGTAPADFHRWCGETLARWPHTLLASSTHDTKRSEDVRARLHLLSEIPALWAVAVRRWIGLLAPHRTGALPDRNAEYLFYQTLVGAWPIEPERVKAYLEKAVREAKTHTSWRRPEPDYEAALARFVDGALADRRFLADVEAFTAPLIAAGRVNSLSLALLKLTAPGVPDLYQGCETWTSSLVDPDNRRPIDWDAQRARLRAIDALGDPREIWRRCEDGLPKLWTVRRALDLRRRRPECFGPEGAYRPLEAVGARAGHALCFARGAGVVVAAPRLVLGLLAAGGYGDTQIELPPGGWRDVLSGERRAGSARLADLLARFPVALLERDDG